MRSIDQNMSNIAAQFPFRYEAWVFLGEQNIDFFVRSNVWAREQNDEAERDSESWLNITACVCSTATAVLFLWSLKNFKSHVQHKFLKFNSWITDEFIEIHKFLFVLKS